MTQDQETKPAGDAAAGQPTRDPMYRVIVALLVVDVLLGLGLAVFGEAVLQIRQLAFVGLAMALIGIAILAFYIAIGHQADRRAKIAAAAARDREK